MARGNFLHQGSSPCSLHWQVDSLPLNHYGSPNLHCKDTLREGDAEDEGCLAHMKTKSPIWAGRGTL